MFERLRRFLAGEFVCIHCLEKNHLLTFGYGWCVCHKCYVDEIPWLWWDRGFFLNRLVCLTHLTGPR